MLTARRWPTWQKVSFRFFFLFLGSSTFVPWTLAFFFASSIFFKNPTYDFDKIYTSLVKPLYWLDKHIYHIGYDPKIHQSVPGDNHFGLVFYLALLSVAIIATIVWSILDKQRPGYNRLFYWFTVYLRYLLAITMFGYGIDKLIPVQMPYPTAVDLLTPLGEQVRFNVLWTFMGASPGFMIFTGSCEILASLLLLYRRTAVLGSAVMAIILCNVVAFNIFYNVIVKLFSSLLLVYTLFLLAPHLKKIFQFFFYNQPAVLTRKHFVLQTRWKKYCVLSLLIIVPFFIFLFTSMSTYRTYKGP